MTEAKYNEFLERLSNMPIKRISTDPLEYLLINETEATLEYVRYRADSLQNLDYDCWGGYLDLGLFRQLDVQLRLACICICMEASAMRHRREIIQSCDSYNKEQPLFKQFSKLWDDTRKEELVSYANISRLPQSHIFHIKKAKGYGVIDKRLPLSILSLIDEYTNKPVFIKLDPYNVSSDRIPDCIEEAVVNYPDPTWWSDLRIYDGKEKGSSYQLLDDPSNHEDYWNYLVKGIRRLEYHVERRDESTEQPYLSMMMEELELHSNKAVEDENYLVGRMIHLDTRANVGDSFKDAVLQHIDLAYNYYFGEKIEKRMSQDLSLEGRVEDASVRTHILRIENVTLNELFPIAFAFFKSKTMVNEWCHYQFMNAEFDANHRIKK